MKGFKKEKTANFQLFDVIRNNLFCDFASTQESVLFRRNLNKEEVFLKQLAINKVT
jgi:hypothetical protein